MLAFAQGKNAVLGKVDHVSTGTPEAQLGVGAAGGAGSGGCTGAGGGTAGGDGEMGAGADGVGEGEGLGVDGAGAGAGAGEFGGCADASACAPTSSLPQPAKPASGPALAKDARQAFTSDRLRRVSSWS